MAQLHPADFDLKQMVEAEQRAAALLLANLDASWFVVPHVTITDKGTDSEIDFVLVSPDHGIFCAEVKGGRINLQAGQWYSNDHKIKNPANQVSSAKHNLIKRLHTMKVDLSKMFVQHIVVLPDIIDFPAHGAGPECPREIVFTKIDLASPQGQLLKLRHHKAETVPEATVRAVLKALRPDVRDVQVDGSYVEGVSQRIDSVTRGKLDALLPLDINPRIFVEGAAGTGKTYLAHHWTKRALDRGERTLFVCYNRALGNELFARMSDVVEDVDDPELLRTGSFHAIANVLLGPHAPAVHGNLDQHFWDTKHAELLVEHRDDIPFRFDTVIIDEGQDFQPTWIPALQGLLAGPDSRLYVMTDPRQAIYAEPLVAPPGTTRVPLTLNIRNTEGIAEVVSALGGAAVSPLASPGPQVDLVVVGAAKERRKKIAATIKKAHEDLGIPLSQILVAVPHRADVTDLTSQPVGDYTLATWADRSEDTVACATIHGTKGLERLAVILSSMDTEPDPRLTYVGASRASVFLAVIGSKEFVDQVAESSSGEPVADPGDDIAQVKVVPVQP